MNQVTEVAEAAKSAGLAPEVQMILVIVGLLLLVSAPAMLFLRDWKKRGKVDEIEGKTSDIQTGLYTHLYEQVNILTQRLDKVHDEYNDLVTTNAKLSARVELLEKCEKTVERLTEKLDEKDAIIVARDTQINQMFSEIKLRDQKIIDLQERIHLLEVRLARDESRWASEKDDGK